MALLNFTLRFVGPTKHSVKTWVNDVLVKQEDWLEKDIKYGLKSGIEINLRTMKLNKTWFINFEKGKRNESK
jgi:hypothetical protein